MKICYKHPKTGKIDTLEANNPGYEIKITEIKPFMHDPDPVIKFDVQEYWTLYFVGYYNGMMYYEY